jgi:hypothetical protein
MNEVLWENPFNETSPLLRKCHEKQKKHLEWPFRGNIAFVKKHGKHWLATFTHETIRKIEMLKLKKKLKFFSFMKPIFLVMMVQYAWLLKR